MEKERDLFSVGELTRALRITRRTLLYYEEFGLIRPDVRDGATGNRYYTIDTLVKLRTIRVLQNLGLSLSEIREYFDSAFELPPLIRRLESLRDELNRQIEGLQERSNAEPPQVKRVRLPQQTVYRRVYTAPTVAQRAALLRGTALEAMRLYGTDLTQQMYLVESRIGHPGEAAFCVAVPPESRGGARGAAARRAGPQPLSPRRLRDAARRGAAAFCLCAGAGPYARRHCPPHLSGGAAPAQRPREVHHAGGAAPPGDTVRMTKTVQSRASG